jgi:Zn-dependent protease/predicted transcriptional regulator
VPGRSIRIARIAGIPVGVSPLWLIIVALITWSLGVGYYPARVPGITTGASYALGLLSALLLFASILAHEFGHALVARRHGVEIEEIDLWLLGGVARMRGRPHKARDELRFAIAGPAVTAVVALVFGVAALALPVSTSPALRAVVGYQAGVNLLILGFNLIPAFPLDGGRVARALLWLRSGDIHTATNTAARVGRAFGFLLIALGVVLAFDGAAGGLWFALIGGFLVVSADAERVREQVVATFAGASVLELTSRPAVSIPAESTLAEAEQYFTRYRYTAFPVIDREGRAVGMLSISTLERTPRARPETTSCDDLADHDPALLINENAQVTDLLERPAFGRMGRAVVIDDDGRPVGVISVTDLQRTTRAGQPGDSASGPRTLVPH